jgi:DNA-binding LacI/PurR family transcriptional regulator
LEQKDVTGREYPVPQLVDILTSAVRQARCSVVFEAELELVLLPPGMTREAALSSMQAMDVDGALVAWNWQRIEIDAAQRFVAIYNGAKRVMAHDRSRPGDFTVPFDDDDALIQAVRHCLQRLLS